MRMVFTISMISLTATPAAALTHEEWITAFVRFVDWPTPPPDAALTVCLQHDAPALDLDGKQVRGLNLKVRRVVRGRQLMGCHVYAALAGDELHWARAIKFINHASHSSPMKAPPVLSIGQGARFCDLGGTICLVDDAASGTQTYRLNLDALSRAGFRVDSQLLRTQPSRAAKTG